MQLAEAQQQFIAPAAITLKLENQIQRFMNCRPIYRTDAGQNDPRALAQIGGIGIVENKLRLLG